MDNITKQEISKPKDVDNSKDSKENLQKNNHQSEIGPFLHFMMNVISFIIYLYR